MTDSRFDADQLPAAIRRYLNSPRGRDAASLAEDLFAPDARVVDERIEHSGTDAIRDWLANAASQYTYTTTYTGQTAHAPQHWTVHAHLEGDFPGGQADLRFEFRLDGDRITELIIEP
jgi:hypothetical protein